MIWKKKQKQKAQREIKEVKKHTFQTFVITFLNPLLIVIAFLIRHIQICILLWRYELIYLE